jgi:hypothetical protein
VDAIWTAIIIALVILAFGIAFLAVGSVRGVRHHNLSLAEHGAPDRRRNGARAVRYCAHVAVRVRKQA